MARCIWGNQRKTSKHRGLPLPNYSSDDFVKWLLNHESFEELYQKWVDSGYSRWASPSVDRIDNEKPYTLETIILTDWQSNFDRGNLDRKNCIKITLHRKVVQFDLNGKKIKEFLSVSSASRETGTHRVPLYKCCKGIYHTAGGYKWKYLDEI